MNNRHQGKLTWGAVLMALATMAGSVTKAYFDSVNDDSVKTVIAREKATADEWRRLMEEDLKDMRSSNKELHGAVLKLTGSVEALTHGRRSHARRELPIMAPAPVTMKAPAKYKAPPAMVQQVKEQLFRVE